METNKMLYIFWKFIGLLPFNLMEDGGFRFSYGGAVYSITLSLFYATCYIGILNNPASLIDQGDTPISILADIIAKTVQFVTMLVTWLCFGLRQKALGKIQKLFKEIIENCEILDVHENHIKIMRNTKIQTFLINCIFITLFIITSPFQLSVRIPFNFVRIVYPNFTIQFIATMSIIRNQFRSVNSNIREISKEGQQTISIRSSPKQRRKKIGGSELSAESNSLDGFVHVHSDLVDLTKSIINFCSPSLYLIIVIHLAELASSLYDISLSIRDTRFSSTRNLVYFIAQNIWVAYHLLGLIAVVAVSDSTSYQANRIGNVLHEILVSRPLNTCLESETILSLQLSQRRLDVQLFGMISMKHSLVYKVSLNSYYELDLPWQLMTQKIISFFNVVTTYITIMLQLDT